MNWSQQFRQEMVTAFAMAEAERILALSRFHFTGTLLFVRHLPRVFNASIDHCVLNVRYFIQRRYLTIIPRASFVVCEIGKRKRGA